MADKLTPQQLQAVTDRGGKLLVSAAAGSGKTKVLVDRILSYLKDPVSPANLDDFLIITYTKAAAAELRGKIAARLSEEISAHPSNRHLQKQLQRLYLTKISTVHAFCADILREHAYHLDIPVDFRVAEENECLELQFTAIEKLLDSAYKNAETDADFCAFVDSQGFGRNDRQLPEIILKLYNSARCHMDPDGWMDWCLQVCNASELGDASETAWAKYLIDDLHSYLDMHIDALSKCAEQAACAEGMEKPVALLYETIDQLRALRNRRTWDEITADMDIDYGKLTFPRKNFDAQIAASIKAVRDACKKGVQKKLRRFSDNGRQVLADIDATASAARGLVSLTRQFSEEYDKLKKRKRVLDFGDLEHKTLDLLLGKHRYGVTAIAAEIGRRFREVMVDEYQDSNEVQDAIFTALTEERQNCFMVGDVKQSIYQFRLADPEIFLDKYNRYVPADDAVNGQGRKVLLSNNFRSSKGVIDAVNDVFSACMSERVGGLDYGADEMLYEGVTHVPLNETEVELYGICVNESAYTEEAAFVADRISQLLDGTHMIRDGDTLRAIRAEDIVILLRSPGSVGGYYANALDARGIRCCTGNATNLLDTEEVQTIRVILQSIDNPLQDIPLIAMLTSKIFKFTADDLAAFRSKQRNGSIYAALRNDTSDKIQNFLRLFDDLRQKARTNSLSKLIKHIFTLTKLDSIFASMPDGEIRMENLLSFYKIASDFDASGGKSLNRFLGHLDALEEKGLAAATQQTNTGAVTIMSIHKSKGLEFPVVFLPGLSRGFNNESAYAQMLCDKDLGLGLSCVDGKRRIRYPSVSKRAIVTKMLSESLSEEMRVLYVAMTRARDRLIMTYASKYLESELLDLSLRMAYTNPVLLTGEANCPGKWILLSALKRAEAGAFFSVSSQPDNTQVHENPWKIRIVSVVQSAEGVLVEENLPAENILEDTVSSLKRSLKFQYPYIPATQTPSKQTATQLKGREKDMEAAENTKKNMIYRRNFRKPGFLGEVGSGVERGNAMHTVMQYICYEACADQEGVTKEIQRLIRDGYITNEQAQWVDANKITSFFATEIGKKLRVSKDVLREFKFSILDDASRYTPEVTDEQILLQGVVDCALLESDGITVIDFKTDRVTAATISETAENYRSQILAYADALKRIYQKPVKAVMLYFFDAEEIVFM